MSLLGIETGLLALLILGLGFPLVILTERYLGCLWWPYLLGLGFLIILASLFIAHDWLSLTAGLLGATLLWGSTELKTQSIRSALGWFPSRPRKIKPPFAHIIARWPPPGL